MPEISFCQIFQGYETIYYEQRSARWREQLFALTEEFISQFTIIKKTLMKRRVTQDRIKGLLNLVAAIAGNNLTVNVMVCEVGLAGNQGGSTIVCCSDVKGPE